MLILARRAPPDPREGFNPSSSFRKSTLDCTFFVPPVADPGESHGEPIVDHNLPPRPNLDHLRGQAKALLNALARGEPEAVATIRQHLPSAQGMSPEQVLKFNFRLADAQSAIARATGFASWPQLSRHVEQLRALEGTWEFASLVVDGQTMPAQAMSSSRLLIDGDRFRTESPEATYEGVFNINVEAQPHEIDIEFVAGPEAGNWNFGIFRLEGDQLELCLDLNGRPRPTEFRAARGSGHAHETLRRSSHSRPEHVTGGTPAAQLQVTAAAECVGFDFVPSPALARLEGDWSAVKLVRDGQEAPSMILPTGRRNASKNEIKISFGGQLIIHALIRIDGAQNPIHVDYYNIGGFSSGTIQQGIMKWVGDDACFCMAGPGQPRPTDFESAAGSGRTLSQWRPKRS
jgi:uncharacterized protein (TIGR03067 family)